MCTASCLLLSFVSEMQFQPHANERGDKVVFLISVAGIDYEPLNTTITFQKEEVIKRIRVRLIDNQLLQQKRVFGAAIEVVQGDFPARVQNDTASIEISDDDSK